MTLLSCLLLFFKCFIIVFWFILVSFMALTDFISNKKRGYIFLIILILGVFLFTRNSFLIKMLDSLKLFWYD